MLRFFFLLLLVCPAAGAQSIDVTPYVLPVDPANRGAEIAEIHPAYDLDPQAADFGGKQIPAVWRSNGLVTGLMGILRFGPAVPAFLCWKAEGRTACPPFHPLAGGARMTRMQSDAITLRYQPFDGVEVEQTMMAVGAHAFRSRARVRAARAARLEVALHAGILEQSETGHVKWPPAPPSGLRFEHKGVVYLAQLYAGRERSAAAGGDQSATALELEAGESREIEFVLSFGAGEEAASDAMRRARVEFFDIQLAFRRKRSEEFFARVPQYDFGDTRVNLFHRIMWERLRALAENAAGGIPYPYFMGTSAPWGIDGLWLWDAVFQSQVLQARDPRWAEDLLRAVLAQQREDGLVPHWSTPRSRTEISQPPLLSWAALRLYTLHGRREFLEEVYPRLAKLHRWFEKARTRPDGLPFWKQPDESGMDNSPAFDEGTDAHVDLAAELLADSQALERIARLLNRGGLDRHAAGAWRKLTETWRARLEKMWDESAGFYFPMKAERRVPVFAIQGFFPLWDARLAPQRRQRLLARLQDEAEFWPPYPVPSVSLRAPQFMQPKWFANTYGSPETGRRATERLEDYTSVYWRGPVWIFSNAIIYEALRGGGEFAVANELGRRMVAMMMDAARYGGMLWENFDPRTGRPSRLLPKGQADEMAASIYFLKALYDLRVALETSEAPERARLRLRYTNTPTASVKNLRFGDWTVASVATGESEVALDVEHAPSGEAMVEIENASGAPLRVRAGGRTHSLAPGKKVSFKPTNREESL